MIMGLSKVIVISLSVGAVSSYKYSYLHYDHGYYVP